VSDWSASELTDEQLRYAVGDVMHLLRLLDVMEAHPPAPRIRRQPPGHRRAPGLTHDAPARPDHRTWRGPAAARPLKGVTFRSALPRNYPSPLDSGWPPG